MRIYVREKCKEPVLETPDGLKYDMSVEDLMDLRLDTDAALRAIFDDDMKKVRYEMMQHAIKRSGVLE